MNVSIDLDGHRTLVAEVDAAEQAQARALLSRLVPQARGMREGEVSRVELDWAVLQLHAGAGVVNVQEPAYQGDPAVFCSSLTLTGRVFAAQGRLLDTLALTGAPVQARQFVRAASDALDAESVVGVRQLDREAPFTGWQIVPATRELSTNAEYGEYTVEELAARRLAWMTGLCLPVGWAFRMVGRCLVDAVAPDGTTHELGIVVDV